MDWMDLLAKLPAYALYAALAVAGAAVVGWIIIAPFKQWPYGMMFGLVAHWFGAIVSSVSYVQDDPNAPSANVVVSLLAAATLYTMLCWIFLKLSPAQNEYFEEDSYLGEMAERDDGI